MPLDPLPSELDEASHYPSAVDLPSSNPSPEAEEERTELRETIETGMAALPEEQRLAVLLVDIHRRSSGDHGLLVGDDQIKNQPRP